MACGLAPFGSRRAAWKGSKREPLAVKKKCRNCSLPFNRSLSKGSYLSSISSQKRGPANRRLLYEFTRWLDVQNQPIRLFKGRATQEISQIPYALLRDIFASSFGIQDNDSAAIARQTLETGILSYVRDEETATLYTHFIGHLIGLDFSNSVHLKGILGDARQIHDRAFHYAAQFFTDITHDQVGVIFLEDIHWADRGSLDFFDHLMNYEA